MRFLRKRITAGILAGIMLVSSLQSSTYTVNAQEVMEEANLTPQNSTESNLPENDLTGDSEGGNDSQELVLPGEESEDSDLPVEEPGESKLPEEDLEEGNTSGAGSEEGSLSGEDSGKGNTPGVDSEESNTTGEDTEEGNLSVEEPEENIMSGEDSEESNLPESDEQQLIVENVETDGIYQFGGAPSDEGAEVNYSIEPDDSVETDYTVNGITIEDYLYNEMLKRSTTIDVSAFKMPYDSDKINKMLNGVINEHPDLYYARPIQYGSDGTRTYLARVIVEYNETLDDAAFKRETAVALSVVKPGMSNLQKAVALHDYLAVNCEYDYDNYLAENIPQNSYSAYGVLVERTAVCQGYALAYKYLLNQVGITCYMVNSSSMNHAWNLIELDGQYYQVDVTWDDPTRDLIGRARHAYMFCSDADFGVKDSNKNAHSNWSVTAGGEVVDYKAVDTRYDSAFWKAVNTPLVLAGDTWNDCYYAYYDTTEKTCKINKAALSNVTEKGSPVVSIGTWSVWGQSSWWQAAYTGLFMNGGRLYFNDKTSIRSVALDGSDLKTEFTADTTNGYIYGSALCQGKVLYSLHQSYDIKEKETVLTANININVETPSIPVESIELDKNTLTLKKGESAELKATVTPVYATDAAVSWSSSNEFVATVVNGVVSAVGAGSCTIMASAGGKSAVCSVTVTEEEAPPIEKEEYITAVKVKREYEYGEALTLDDITVTYYDRQGNPSKVTNYTTNASELDMSVPGTKRLVITYNGLSAEILLIVRQEIVSGGDEDDFKVELKYPEAVYIYTGSAIMPEIVVTNNNRPLTAGIDYTVKYSNNIKASESAKITVTGKGNLSGKKTKEFTIEPKSFDEAEGDSATAVGGNSAAVVEGDYATVVEGSKVAPILIYNGVKLTSKDFKVPDEYKAYKWKEGDDKTITVTGQGNFKGEREIDVKVISKAEQSKNKIIVSLSKDAKNLVYNGEEQKIGELITVSTKNMPGGSAAEQEDGITEPLREGRDYIISYPADITSAGTKKFTVTGISSRCVGSVAKSYTIKPKKTEFSVEYDTENNGYAFVSAGTTITDLVVKDGDKILNPGTDYKVSYSGNKKAGTAKFTITGLGNYKGSKYKGNFIINAAVLSNNAESASGVTQGLKITVADKVFKKAGIYKSAPYVSINGVLLKASNYTVEYYLDNPMNTPNARAMDKNNKVTNEDGDTTVWVKITGKQKGNYATKDNTCYAVASYKVRSLGGAGSYDLSKAKVTFRNANGEVIKRVNYTGLPIGEDKVKVVVTYKLNGEEVTLIEGIDYSVDFVNNVNKGKATVVVTGMDGQNRYIGSKTAGFSIVANNINNILNWFK